MHVLTVRPPCVARCAAEDGPILPVAPMLVPPAPDAAGVDGEDEMWLNTVG